MRATPSVMPIDLLLLGGAPGRRSGPDLESSDPPRQVTQERCLILLSAGLTARHPWIPFPSCREICYCEEP